MKTLVVKGIQCPKCDDRIWSRGQHHLRKCKCGASFVDGGREYLRIGGAAAIDGKAVISIHLEPRDARVWISGNRYLVHSEMSPDHLRNCIIHLNERLAMSVQAELDGEISFENQNALQEIIDQMREELTLRDEYEVLH
jgi:hypothetical protein